MFRSLIVILLIGGTSFYHTDISSDAMLNGVLLPLVDFFSAVALVLWIVLFLHKRGIRQAFGTGDAGSGFGGDIGGGDGGC